MWIRKFIPILVFGLVFGLVSGFASELFHSVEDDNIYAGITLAVLFIIAIFFIVRDLKRRRKSLKDKVFAYVWILLLTLFFVLVLLKFYSLVYISSTIINIVFLIEFLYSAIMIIFFIKENTITRNKT